MTSCRRCLRSTWFRSINGVFGKWNGAIQFGAAILGDPLQDRNGDTLRFAMAGMGRSTRRFNGFGRITSTIALAAFVFFIAADLRLIPSLLPLPRPASGVSWDPCMIWEQIPFTVKLATLYFVALLVVLIVQGFRKRSVPPVMPIVGLIAIGITVNHELWFVGNCYTGLRAVAFWSWVCTSGLLFLLHVARNMRFFRLRL